MGLSSKMHFEFKHSLCTTMFMLYSSASVCLIFSCVVHLLVYRAFGVAMQSVTSFVTTSRSTIRLFRLTVSSYQSTVSVYYRVSRAHTPGMMADDEMEQDDNGIVINCSSM